MTHNEQLLDREPVRSMDSAEVLRHLWRFRHSRVASLGIDSTRWGRRVRHDVGLEGDYGTFWWADLKERFDLCILPQGSIPYAPVLDAAMDPERNRFRSTGETWRADVARGWRGFFSMLTKSGILYPCRELSYLIGEDTWRLSPRYYHE